MLRFPDCPGVAALPIDDSTGHGPPTAFGPYRVLHQVGSGVLGPVFRTHDPVHDRLIAVKSIKLDIVPEDVARLADALRDLAHRPVPHPGAVNVIAAGVEGERAFYATEYAAGESLDLALRHLAPAPLDVAIPLLRALADVIDAAWETGVGHGALHPRDVFLVPEGGVRVTAIGIAMALQQAGLSAPIRRPYTAPERGDKRPWDQRADVYSLGAIAHELLTGRRLATAGEHDGALAALGSEARSIARQGLAKALATDPDDRFASATAFVDALAAVPAGTEGIATAPVAPTPRVQRDPVIALDATAPLAGRPLAPAVDVAERELARVPPRPDATAPLRAQVVPPAPHRDMSSPYPWGAIAAVAIAALLVGVAGGYAVGRRGAAPPIPVAAPGQAETEVPVAADPAVPEAPRTAGRDAQPAANVAVPTPGRVVVRSVPAGALVTVDGRRAGETPTTVTGLSLGAHTLLIARPGYAPRSERVTLTAADPSRALTVELQPGLDVAAAQLGSIYIDTRPRGARVTIDGRVIGTTPIRVPDLPRGDHRVLVELEGFRAHSTLVTVRPGEQARLAVTLVREERE